MDKGILKSFQLYAMSRDVCDEGIKDVGGWAFQKVKVVLHLPKLLERDTIHFLCTESYS